MSAEHNPGTWKKLQKKQANSDSLRYLLQTVGYTSLEFSCVDVICVNSNDICIILCLKYPEDQTTKKKKEKKKGNRIRFEPKLWR